MTNSNDQLKTIYLTLQNLIKQLEFYLDESTNNSNEGKPAVIKAIGNPKDFVEGRGKWAMK